MLANFTSPSLCLNALFRRGVTRLLQQSLGVLAQCRRLQHRVRERFPYFDLGIVQISICPQRFKFGQGVRKQLICCFLDIREHRVLADLLDHSGAGRNPLRRLDVERTFEVRGTRSEPGRLYASGTATLGGYFPGVDTFLGLQIAAQEIADDLAARASARRSARCGR